MSRPLLAIALACLLSSACSLPMGRSSIKAESERKAAPNFSLKDSGGKTVQLSDYRGKVVLLNFWATWCGPCKMEIPWFIDFERELKDQGFAVIGVSMDDEGWQAVRPFVSEEGINYRVLLANDSIGELYGGIDSLPTTFVIDREGRVAAVHIGLVSKSRYANDLKQLLENNPAHRAGTRNSGGPAVVAGRG